MPNPEHVAQLHVEGEASRLFPPRGVQGLCRKLKPGTVDPGSSPSSPRGLLGKRRVHLSISADPFAWLAGSAPCGQ